MDKLAEKKVMNAQLKEAKHAKEAARAEREAARHERDVAQATKGGDRVPQPDDWSML